MTKTKQLMFICLNLVILFFANTVLAKKSPDTSRGKKAY